MPAGSGRDTHRLSASQKRHGRSTARVMPMRSPTAMRGARRPAGGGSTSIGLAEPAWR